MAVLSFVCHPDSGLVRILNISLLALGLKL